MVLVCLIVIAALAACVISAWRRAGAAPSPAARPAERWPAEVIEEGFSGESIAYGRSVMDHPMLEQESANFCERIKADIQREDGSSGELWYQLCGDTTSMMYSKNQEHERTFIHYGDHAFPAEGQRWVSGHDVVLGTVWAMQHLTLAGLRREVPGITYTGASVVTDRENDVECILCIRFKK